jgi:hypothetical protein
MRLNLSALSGRALCIFTTDTYDILFENRPFRPIKWSKNRPQFKQEHGTKLGYKSGVSGWGLLEILSESQE